MFLVRALVNMSVLGQSAGDIIHGVRVCLLQ